MDSNTSKKPHVVLVPFPAQGHIIPLMQLAKLLHSQGFYITFVNTEFNHRRLIRSGGPDAVKGLPNFRFETIPDGLPPSDRDAMQDVPALCDSVRKNCLAPFRELLAKLNTFPDVPNVSCIISDGVMSFAIEAADEIGVPEVQFWTASACSFMGYLNFSELVRRGIVPFKDEKFTHDGTLENPIEWIPGMRSIRLRDIPSFIRTTNINDIMFNFMGGEAHNCLTSSAIVFNTFDEFEKQVLDAIATKFPSIYTIGPLPLMLSRQVQEQPYSSNSINSNLWKEDTTCLEWLDKREPNSVVYVNYGSVTTMTDDHLKEFAWGLANSKHPFIWIVRPDVVKGDFATTLPPEFMEVIEGQGLIASWCSQYQVLRHPSIGAFLTHCGWNSMIETVCAGIPVICWPFFADQQTNCRYAGVEWGTGVEVDHDVKRDQIEGLVRMMLEGEKAKRMKEKALYWKKKAEEATSIGGSSYSDFERFLRDYLAKVC